MVKELKVKDIFPNPKWIYVTSALCIAHRTYRFLKKLNASPEELEKIKKQEQFEGILQIIFLFILSIGLFFFMWIVKT